MESIILAHPELLECGALPYPAEQGEDEVRVVIVLWKDSNLTLIGLLDWLKDQMPSFMMPSFVGLLTSCQRAPLTRARKSN
jgi:acyl-coenzyme A synthetase/AMP-(fatty) acid ligase